TQQSEVALPDPATDVALPDAAGLASGHVVQPVALAPDRRLTHVRRLGHEEIRHDLHHPDQPDRGLPAVAGWRRSLPTAAATRRRTHHHAATATRPQRGTPPAQ